MASKKPAPPKVRVQYHRSAIGSNEAQKRVVKGLGFRKLNAVREFRDTPEVRGMIAKISHLVRVVPDQD